MSLELSQLDEINETDLLAALGEDVEVVEKLTNVPDDLLDLSSIEKQLDNKSEQNVDNLDDITTDKSVEALQEDDTSNEIDDIGDIEILPLAEIESAIDEQEEIMQVDSSKVTDIAKLLGELLNNKTIEITIKIKD